jgi:divalent metal cation (Fe/Co/Zn/Cd) transporter
VQVQPSPDQSRRSLLQRALWLSVASVIWNGIAGGAAVVIALSTGSLALLGFGFDAAIDSIASIALIWRFATEHGQPHRADRVERIAAAVVGAVLVVLGLYLGLASIQALLAHEGHEVSVAALALLVASAVVLPPLGVAKLRTARQLDSLALRGDSILTLVAALLAGVGVLSAVLSEALGMWWADPLGGLLVSLVLLREGVSGLAEVRAGSTSRRATL